MKKTLLTLALISFCCIPKLFAEESYRIELEQQLEKIALRCTESIQYLDGVTSRKPLADIATSLEILIAELKVTKDDDHEEIFRIEQQAQEDLQCAIILKTEPEKRLETLALMQQRNSLTPQQALEQHTITVTIEEFEQKYSDLLVEEISMVQTYKRIFFRTLLEFLFGVINETLKKQAVKKTNADPFVRVYSIGEQALPSIASRWPEIVTELMKYVTIYATDKVLPNHKPTVKQRFAELLIPRIVGKSLAKAVTFDWKNDMHGSTTINKVGKFSVKTGTSLFFECLMVIILVRGYMNKKNPYYKYVDALARIAPFTLGSDTFKSAVFNWKNLHEFFSSENPLLKEDAPFVLYRVLGNIAVDGLEGMVIFGLAEEIAKKLIPDWMSVPAKKQLAKSFKEVVKKIIQEGDPCLN